MSQAELARRVGISQPAVNALVKGNSRSTSHLHTIARCLRTSAAYLNGEIDDPDLNAVSPPTEAEIAEHLDLVEVREIDLAYGLGGTYSTDPVEVRIHRFPREFIAAITNSAAESLVIARGSGDSMSPTIHDGDLVIFDQSQKSVREQDALWAFTIGEIAMIKRLRVRGETVTILSDNDRVPPDTAHPDEVNVVGRVVFIGRRM